MTQLTSLTPKALRVKDAAKYIGIGESTFWKWAKNGKLPEGRKLSERCTVWSVKDLDAYLDAQAEEKHV